MALILWSELRDHLDKAVWLLQGNLEMPRYRGELGGRASWLIRMRIRNE